MMKICGCPVGIVDIADDFYEAFLRCKEGKNTRMDEFGRTVSDVVNIPAIVNGSFALELYLKSLIPEEKRKRLHDISALFSLLAPEHQSHIKESVQLGLNGRPESFDEALDGINNAFAFWRYIHEKSELEFGFNQSLIILPLFLDAIREIIHGNEKAD